MVTTNSVIPKTMIEIIFFSFASIFNAGVFGYLIHSIGNILDNIKKRESTNRKELKILDRYMSK